MGDAKNFASKGWEGSTVIVTTRSEKVASIMGTTSLHHLKGLGEDDCWVIFNKGAFSNPSDEERHSNLLPIGKEIVKKCGGVPLAAKTLGSVLHFKREEREWLYMKSSELWNSIGDSQTGILPALRLSYNHLPLHLKRCFAFCSIFPKSYHIKKEKLIHLWMAEEFLPSKTYAPAQLSRRPEDIGNGNFNDLFWTSFFEVVKKSDNDDCRSNITELKMHDLLHDLARSIGANEFMILEHTHLHLRQSEYLALIRHVSVSFHINSFPNALFQAKHLQTLLFLSGGDLRDNAQFSRFKYLRVLDLSHCGITVLHQSIGDLVFLKYLDLSYNHIIVLPDSICNLQRMQTLDLSGCFYLTELPNLMGNMTSLRHLNITGCLQLARMPSYISKLYKLQTLPIYVVENTHERSISQLGSLDLHGELKIKHLGRLDAPDQAWLAKLGQKRNLELLGLYWRDIDDESLTESDVASLLNKKRSSSSRPLEQHEHDAAVAEEVISAFKPHYNLKRFLLREYPGTKFPAWIVEHRCLIKVDLSQCNRCQFLPTLGKLWSLKILTLRGMKCVKRIGKEFYGEEGYFFRSLKQLVLIDFPSLEEWSSPPFLRVSKLIINGCPNLKAMPSFPSLQHLELRDCSASLLDSTEISNSISVFIIEEVPGLLSLSGKLLANKSSLTSLEIFSCPNLQSLPSELGNLTALKSLTIRWCDKLSCLPQGLENLTALESLEIGEFHSLTALPDDQIRGLSSLRILSIANCTNLSSLLPSLRCLASLERLTVMLCQRLDSLPEDLRHLPSFHSLTIISCPKFSCLPQGLQHVKTLHRLEIRSCPGLMALPEHVESLALLRSLAISDCPNLKRLPDGLELLTALQHLSIQECPELEERCTKKGSEEWLKIAHIPHKHIGSPESRQSSAAGTSTSV
ncbi:putative disease resistance protein RGA1 [Cornus florida]|uniref:putative disease resistance protein RGA1 n=1 Tax=Cornus florida TaxID=4283 RepID=UPI0028986FB3|nr:putative disease resistance protein RGA1 [Cornus florida]